MNTKHTPEPWVNEGCDIFADNHLGRHVSTIEGEGQDVDQDYENAQRIVTCVNACRDIQDPATAIPMMVEALKMVVAGQREVLDHCKRVLAAIEEGNQA